MIAGGADTEITLRRGRPADAEACGRICFEAFGSLASHHGFPSDFPSVETGVALMSALLSHPRFFSVVAERDGAIVGSNFLDERSPIAGLGPISVDPHVQNRQVGRRLMEAALGRAREAAYPGVRLLQTAYHARSLGLYATLGFQVREAVACMQGPAIGVPVTGHLVRAAREEDLDACDRVCRLVHGHDRRGEVLDAVRQGTARVVEHDGRITGYATDLAFFGHAAAETNPDLIALIGAASAFGGPGILVPLRNAPVFRWCLDHGLKVVQVMTLMTLGLYNDPEGAWLPSVLY
jgi:predicted N-acetyltransferase YhbS